MAPFRTTAVIPLSPYLQIHSHHSLIPFIPSRFHCIYPSAHNNPSVVFEARRGTRNARATPAYSEGLKKLLFLASKAAELSY